MFEPSNQTQQFLKRLHKAFDGYQKGLVTESEVLGYFFDLLDHAGNVDDRAELACDLPEWARITVLKRLNELESMDFYQLWFAIGDMRTLEQVHRDALRRQAMLREFAPQLRKLLNQATE